MHFSCSCCTMLWDEPKSSLCSCCTTLLGEPKLSSSEGNNVDDNSSQNVFANDKTNGEDRRSPAVFFIGEHFMYAAALISLL